MIKQWVMDLIKLFSFVEKVEKENFYIYIYYKKDGKLIYRKVSARANKVQLLNALDKIKSDIKYKTIKLNRDKELKKKLKDEKIMFSRI